MEWKKVKLEELLAVPARNGLTKPSAIRGTGVPMIAMGELFANPIINDIKTELVPVTDKELSSSSLMPGDILFARQSLTLEGAGQCSFIKHCAPNTVFESHLIRIRLDQNKAIPRYIYYYFKSYKGKGAIANIVNQVAAAGIKGSELVRLEIDIPSTLEDQRRIADILSSLDAQIENNNRINRNLEEQAQALFKSWFVDFEPFAKDRFVESEIGEIPVSLKVDKIANIPHSLETGRRPKGGVGEIKVGVPSVGAEHVKGLGTYDFSKTKYIPSDFAESVKSGIVKGYELLIYKDGGKPGYFIPNFSIFGEGYPFDYCILNEHVFKLDFCGNRAYNAFAYFYFHTDYVMNYLNAEGGKAAIPGINQQAVNSLLIFSPDNPKVQEFGNIVLPMITKILRNLSQSSRLAALRDTLLPKLMKGEIEVSKS